MKVTKKTRLLKRRESIRFDGVNAYSETGLIQIIGGNFDAVDGAVIEGGKVVRFPAMVSVADKPAERRMFECDDSMLCELTLGAGVFERGDNVFVTVKADPSRTDIRQGEVQAWVVGS